jgi:hypothetical protein
MPGEMMSNVIPIGGYTKLPIDPNNVLNSAIDKLDFVFLAGIDKDGSSYFAASGTDINETLWLIEKFKFKLMNGDFG